MTMLPNGCLRPQITDEEVALALDMMGKLWRSRLEQKGRGATASPHESFGIIAEEVDEMLDALRANDERAFTGEALDIGVACLLAIGSALAHGRESPPPPAQGKES